MAQKDVIRKIVDSLTNELEAYDFQPASLKQGFTRNTDQNIFFFQLIALNRTIIKTGAKGFLIEPYIWVNVRKVEKYYRQITINKELKRDDDFVTIGNSVANLLANPDGLYKSKNNTLELHVFEEKDITDVAGKLLKAFKQVALSYCLKNDSVGVIDKIVNSNPGEEKVHMMNDNYRVIKGAIAAKLNNNPALDKIIQIYERQIIDDDMYNAKEEWGKLIDILPSIN